MLKKLLQKIAPKTQKVGRKLARVGLGLGTLGVSMEFVDPATIEFLPEEHRIYYIVIMRVLEIIGGLLLGAGATNKTKEEA